MAALEPSLYVRCRELLLIPVPVEAVRWDRRLAGPGSDRRDAGPTSKPTTPTGPCMRCQEFESDAALRAVFVTVELRPFRDRIRGASAAGQRVAYFIEDVLEWSLPDGQGDSAVDVLTEYTEHPNDEVPKASIESLGRIGGEGKARPGRALRHGMPQF